MSGASYPTGPVSPGGAGRLLHQEFAHEAGNEDTARLLSKVVEVVDEATGTVRLKKKVDAADEMALDTRSVKTVRVKKG